MNLVRVSSLEDPRLAPFRELSRPTGRVADENVFVTEGQTIVRRLVESDHEVLTIVVEEGRDLASLGAIDPATTVFVMDEDQIRRLAGFNFHRGFLACAVRPRLASVGEIEVEGLSLAALDVQDMENLGSMIRSAAAFGVRRLLIDDRTADPFSRRVIRVSMGAALGLTYARITDARADLRELERRGVVTLAATPSVDSTPIDQIRLGNRPAVLMVGNEARGLPAGVQRLATHRVHLPMRRETMPALVDSLNVSVAAAILLHELRRIQQTPNVSASIGPADG